MGKRRILLYDWGSVSQSDLQDALQEWDSETEIITCNLRWKSYDEDPVFAEKFCQILQEQQITFCMSLNYFPLIAKICAEQDILYVSWVYDCPHSTLYSKTLSLPTNLIFTFDRLQREKFRARGISQMYHLPLAVNVGRLDNMRRQVTVEALKQNFAADISFVGSLYEDNYYRQISYLPPELQGYLDGLCRAQQQLYGMDLLEESLEESRIALLQQVVSLSIDEEYDVSYQEMFCDEFLRKNISYLERTEILECLGKKFETVLYSGSAWKSPHVINRGIVHYRNQMPLVFMASGLNLNCTIRSIQSGIPLRCLDIMGAGGVLISNYQPELEEYFTEGEEWICYHDLGELVEKAEFYLGREDLRIGMAQRGCQKIREEFSYSRALQKMFRVIERVL